MTQVTPSAAAEPLLRTRRGAVLTLTLNRPQAGNALSTAMIAALENWRLRSSSR